MVLAGAGVAVLLLLTLASLWAAGVFRVRQADGSILIIEVDEPNPEVFVDREKVQVTWADGGKKAEFRIKPGTHQVEVRKDGFTVSGDDVTVESGGRRVFKATLTRVAGAGPPSKEDGETRPGPDGEFVSLFNGKDLTGWEMESGEAGGWQVVDGILVGQGNGLWPHILLSKRDYTDFVWRFDYRPTGTETQTAMSAAFLAVPGETFRVNDQNRPWHPYVHLGSARSSVSPPPGTLFWRWRRTLPPQRAAVTKGPDDWNVVEIEVRHPEMRMTLNGEEVCRTNLNEVAGLPDAHPGFKRSSGRIGLLSPGGGAQLRNVRIKELPPRTPAEREALARRSTKRFPARVPDETRGKWCVVGECVVQPTFDEDPTLLFGDPSWSDYDFSAEAERTDRIDGSQHLGLFFRFQDPPNHWLYGLGWADKFNVVARWNDGRWVRPEPAGEELKEPIKAFTWYAMRVSVRGNHGETYLNGVKHFEFQVDAPVAGVLGLRTWKTAAVFRNIKVTSPDGKVLLEGLPDLSGGAR
jgi:hypothetical protein